MADAVITTEIARYADEPSMGLDSDGKLHIAYFDLKRTALMYATNKSGSWIVEVVDNSGDTGHDPSLAVDSNDKVHISYRLDAPYYDQRYATNVGGSWTISTVDNASNVTGLSSIRVDSSGFAHISYNTYDSIMYANNAGGSFSLELVDESGGPDELIGTYSSIIITDSDNAIIVYDKDSGGDNAISVADNITGIWVSEKIRDDSYIVSSRSIAFDSDEETLAILCVDLGETQLKILRNESGSWKDESLGRGYSRGGELTSSAVGSLYVSSSTEMFDSYLEISTDVSGDWQSYALDADMAASSPDIAADDDGDLKLTYTLLAVDYYAVSYVYKDDDSTIQEVVEENTSDYYDDPAIALDILRRPHIVFRKGSSGEIKYADRVTGNWSVEAIASGGLDRQSFALDGNAKAYVAYSKDDEIHYATNAAGMWLSSELDDCSFYCAEVHLSLDLNGNAYLTYVNAKTSGIWRVREMSNVSGSWPLSAVDVTPEDLHGYIYSGLTINTSGNPYIVYSSREDNDIRLSMEIAPGSWSEEIIRSELGDVTYYDYIIDPEGVSYIVYDYGDGNDTSIIYLTNLSGDWKRFVIDEKKVRKPSLALDSSGFANIAYQCDQGICLAIFPKDGF